MPSLRSHLQVVYDLAVSPTSFDFAYALVQSEVERKRRGWAGLRIHVVRQPSLSGSVYSAGEVEWRIRHVFVPLARCIGREVEIVVTDERPNGPDVFDRPYGLHWASDITQLADEGTAVQLLCAPPSASGRAARLIEEVGEGRGLITVTLRESYYARGRNSHVPSWAALSRDLTGRGYAVVVLRDHDRVHEALAEDWGGAVAVPDAVHDVGCRLALYERATLNLGVNNGPSSLLTLMPHARFVIFKMFGSTPEASPLHFLRLGIDPGRTLGFLGPGQDLVWEGDTYQTLRTHVFAALGESGSVAVPPPRRPRPAAACIVEGARRLHRAGAEAGDDLARVLSPATRRALAPERALMLLDEGRVHDAAYALGEADPSPERDRAAVAIAHAARDARVIELLEPLMTRSDEPDWTAACILTPSAGQPRTREDPPTRAATRAMLRVQIPDRATAPEALDLLRRAEAERRRLGHDGLDVEVIGQNDDAFGATSLFPTVRALFLGSAPTGVPTIFPAAPGGVRLATVPPRAARLLDRWLAAQGWRRKGYAVDASGSSPRASAASHGRTAALPRVDFGHLSRSWPIEMLAVLLDGAVERTITDPLAGAICDALDLPRDPAGKRVSIRHELRRWFRLRPS